MLPRPGAGDNRIRGSVTRSFEGRGMPAEDGVSKSSSTMPAICNKKEMSMFLL